MNGVGAAGLALLAEIGKVSGPRKPLSLKQLAAASGRPAVSLGATLARLEARGLVRRAYRTGDPRWRLTPLGRAVAGARARANRDDFRARVWRALRTLRNATAHELVELAARGGERDGLNQVHCYLSALARAGYVAERGRRPGPAGGARKLYRLTDDPGPAAPAWSARARTLVDANRGEVRHV